MRNSNKSPKMPYSTMVREMEKYPGRDHHQMLITSRGSPVAHAYHVWWMSVTTIVSYRDHITSPELAE